MNNLQRLINVGLVVLICIILLIGYYQSLKLLKKTCCTQQTSHTVDVVNSIAKALDSEITYAIEGIHSFSNLPVLKEFADNPNLTIEPFSEQIFQWAQIHQKYFQIRILDKNGMELYRLNRAASNRLYPTPISELQSKKDRHYVIEGKQLRQEQIYLSPLDLNIEHGQISQPLQPTLRLVKGLYNQDKQLIGMIVLNYDAHYLLDKLKAFSSNQISLLNSEGYWLHSPNQENNWGFMLNALHKRFSNQYPEIWQYLNDKEAGTIETKNGVWVFKKIYPLRKIKLGSHNQFEESAMQTFKDYRWVLISHHNLKESQADTYNKELFFWITSTVVLTVVLTSLLTLRLFRQNTVLDNNIEQINKEELEQVTKSSEFGRQEALNYFVDQGNQAMLLFEYGKIVDYNPKAHEWLGIKTLQNMRLKQIVSFKNRESLIQAIKYLDKQHHIKTHGILKTENSNEQKVCVNVFGSKDSFVMLLSREEVEESL